LTCHELHCQHTGISFACRGPAKGLTEASPRERAITAAQGRNENNFFLKDLIFFFFSLW
jgi:hypothetical protein